MKVQNQLNQEKRLQSAISKNGANLNDITNASQSLASARNDAIDYHVSKLQIKDKVMLSTITLSIYQSDGVIKDVVPNLNLEYYEPGFFHALAKSFSTGWQLLLDIILLIAKIWPISVACVIAIIYWFKVKKKVK